MNSTGKYTVDKAPEGTWWVRWIDQVELPSRKSQTPQVRMIIEKIDTANDEPLTSERIFPLAGAKEKLLVDAGLVPLLPIGGIIQEKKICGFMPSPIKNFTVNTNTSIELKLREELPNKPEWWHRDRPYRPISKKRFPLDQYLDGQCTVLKPNNSTLIIPSSEIFRCCYAPISRLANTLLSAPSVDHYIEKLIQADDSFYCEKNNRIEIVLRTGFPPTHKTLLANLLIHPFGRRCLNYLAGSILDEKGNLKASLPFRTSALQISGRCYSLCKSTKRYLIYNITHINWPDGFPDIYYRFDKSNDKGKVTLETDKPKPFSQYSPTYLNVDSSTEDPPVILNEEEPSAPNITPIYGLNATWSNQPKESKTLKETNRSYPGGEKPDPQYDTTSELSMGSPFGRKKGIANCAARPQPADFPITERLQLIIKFMIELDKSRFISSVKSISPKIVTQTRSGRAAHEFPKEYQKNSKSSRKTWLNWSFLEKTKFPQIPRTAFIFEIKNVYNRTTYWIEIESTTQSYHSVKFNYIDHNKCTTHEDIKLILTLISRGKGKKKEIADLTREYFPEIDVRFWRHKFTPNGEFDFCDASSGIETFGMVDYIKQKSSN